MPAPKAEKKLGGSRVGGDGPRQAKADAVEELKEKVSGAAAVVLTEYRGLSVQELADLRADLRTAEAEYKVYKNTLARIVASELELESLKEYLEGPTAFAFATGDPVLLAKALADFAKKASALELKAGLLEGRVLGPDEVKRLASLDSREVMLATTAGMLQSPLARAAALLAASFQNLASALAQLAEKLPGEPKAAVEPSDPAAQTAEEPEAEQVQGGDGDAPEPVPDDGAPAEGDDGPSDETTQQG